MRKDTKAAVFWRCFTILFLSVLAVLLIPTLIIIGIWGIGFPKAAAVCSAAAAALSVPVSVFFAKRYYGCSLILLLDDENSAQNRISSCLQEMGYIKTVDSGNTIMYRSSTIKLLRGSVFVEMKKGCAVLRGPQKPLGHLAAGFENCYDWSDLYQGK